MHVRVLRNLSSVVALGCLAMAPYFATAQAAAAGKGATGANLSRWDIFAGYSYIAPKGTVETPTHSGDLNPVDFTSINGGAIISITRYFNAHVGIEMSGDVHLQNEGLVNGAFHPADDFSGGQMGLIYRFQSGNITPFVHALAGGEVVGGPHWQLDTGGIGLTAGGGMDYETPWFNHHLAIRLFQADYQYAHVNWGPKSVGDDWGGIGKPNAVRLSAGLVFHAGEIAPPPPVTLACTASPSSVFPGDPVTVTAAAGNLNPKLNAIYAWTGTGVSGSGTTATVATGSLAAGTYSVQGTIKEGKPGKEGLKPWETANCSASFTVKEYEPPTISCSANPSTIKPGETSSITSAAVSPQNRPLTYTYTASAGSVSGSGATAEFSSAGAPTGAVGITCNVADDKGHSASANTSVTIEAPVVAPKPQASALCSISFTTDTKRPTRVDNEAKACLDQVALDLKQQADAKVVVIGESTQAEKDKTAKDQKLAVHHKHMMVEDYAPQRAVNAKEYLVTDQGIDASRITVVTSGTDGQTVENYLVPAGADFSTAVSGTTPVDESVVKPVERKPLGAKPVHHHMKMKKAAQ
jgi:hypothetical protein